MTGKYQPLTLTPINFSLTEGTSIPAPPDSPPDTPRPPTPGKGPLDSHPGPDDDTTSPQSPNGELGRTTTNDGTSSTLSPTSPTMPKRPGSVRKFLGLRNLSSSDNLKSEKRPGSPSTIDTNPSLNRKKSGSWFSRRKSSMIVSPVPLEGKENRTTNGTSTAKAAKAAKKGPPPPALPELKSFGVSDQSVSLEADDMFKNIK